MSSGLIKLFKIPQIVFIAGKNIMAKLCPTARSNSIDQIIHLGIQDGRTHTYTRTANFVYSTNDPWLDSSLTVDLEESIENENCSHSFINLIS